MISHAACRHATPHSATLLFATRRNAPQRGDLPRHDPPRYSTLLDATNGFETMRNSSSGIEPASGMLLSVLIGSLLWSAAIMVLLMT